MSDSDNHANVYETTKASVGYVPRKAATRSLYEALGFRCGLEVHQQLKTEKKLFCRCPAGLYQSGDSYDAQLVRHMRPTLSELGEYDGTALMEFKTKKNIIYRIKGETACTYDIDDTPPFAMNREALNIATEIALLLGTQIVGELHITRKQYLDGSIPTGFQRTAIVGIHGEIPLAEKTIRILQLSIEEDSCREVSDVGHERTYTTDRLGIPLVETVTYPDLLTPDEAAEAAQHIRFLTRSTGKVNVGIGATRADVNVSIEGGTRVEIKGVQRIRWIPELTHNEAFRQKALLDIRSELRGRFPDPELWKLVAVPLSPSEYQAHLPSDEEPEVLHAINLPGFTGILSFFTNPGRCFADEISDRVKVVACIEKPNMWTRGSRTTTGVAFETYCQPVKAMLRFSSGDRVPTWLRPWKRSKNASEWRSKVCPTKPARLWPTEQHSSNACCRGRTACIRIQIRLPFPSTKPASSECALRFPEASLTVRRRCRNGESPRIAGRSFSSATFFLCWRSWFPKKV